MWRKIHAELLVMYLLRPIYMYYIFESTKYNEFAFTPGFMRYSKFKYYGNRDEHCFVQNVTMAVLFNYYEDTPT